MKSEIVEQIIREENLQYLVFSKLSLICTDEERNAMEMDKRLKLVEKGILRPDIWLGKGLKAMGWPDNTVIEIKTYLDSRIISENYHRFKRLVEENLINKYVLVYHKSAYSVKPTSLEKDERFEIKSTDELLYLTPIDSGKGHEHNGSIKDIASQTDSDWKSRRDKLLENLRSDLDQNQITLFLGAGVSASAKMPGWTQLLQQLLTRHSKKDSPDYFPCDLANVMRACGESNIIAARYIDNVIDKKERTKIIQETLYQDPQPSALIDSICTLIKNKNIHQAITTNYDQLIEQGLKKINHPSYSVSNAGIIPVGSFPIYHVHGSFNDPNNPLNGNAPDAPVLSEDEYHARYSSGHHWSNIAILNALHHTHCVFIGLSMTDPNLRRLMESAYYRDAPHYVFMPRTPLYEGYYENDKRNKHHFKVQENIMECLGARIIWYELDSSASDSHKELTSLLSAL